MIKRIAVSFTNLITYLLLGLVLILYVMQLKDSEGLTGVALWAGALLALLFLSFAVGFCESRLLKAAGEGRFKILYALIETVCIIIIALAGVELSLKTGIRAVPSDTWQIESLAGLLSKDNSIFAAEPAIGTALLINPGVYGMVRLTSLAFYLGGSSHIVLTYLMIAMHLICALCTYRTARYLFGRTASVVVFALMMLIPSQMCMVSLISEHMAGCMLSAIGIWLFCSYLRLSDLKAPAWIRLFSVLLCSVFLAAAVFIFPAAAVLPISGTFFVTAIKEDEDGTPKGSVCLRIASGILLSVLSIAAFIGLCMLKAWDMGVSLYGVISGYLTAFVPNGHLMINLPVVWGNESYADSLLIFNTALENRIAYGCIIGMAFLFLLRCWFLQESDSFVLRMYFAVICLVTFLNGSTTAEHIWAMPVLCIFAGGLLGLVIRALCAGSQMSMAQTENAGEKTGHAHVKTGHAHVKTGHAHVKTGHAQVKTEADEYAENEGIITVDLIMAGSGTTASPDENNLPEPKISEKKDLDMEYDYEVSDEEDWDV